jgi:hypothetical protein
MMRKNDASLGLRLRKLGQIVRSNPAGIFALPPRGPSAQSHSDFNVQPHLEIDILEEQRSTLGAYVLIIVT